MYRQSREELIEAMKQYNGYDAECDKFYKLPHEEKAKHEVFKQFCEKHGGYKAIVLSDDEICDNKELVMMAKRFGFFRGFHLLSDRLLNDPDIALTLANCDHYEYTKVSKTLRANPELMLKAVKINPSIYCSLPVAVKVNRDIVLEIAKNEPWNLRLLADVKRERREPLQHDKELALLVANRAPEVLIEFFDEELLRDTEVQEIAFKLSDKKESKKRLLKNVWAFLYVDPAYWVEDKSLVKKALRVDGYLLKYLPESYRNDKEAVMIAVKSSPSAIEFCDAKFYDDSEIINAALQEDSEEVLRFASPRLKGDYDLVFKAVKVDALNLQYASDELRDNKEIVKRALKTFGGVLEDASERLQGDEELVKLAKENS